MNGAGSDGSRRRRTRRADGITRQLTNNTMRIASRTAASK